MANDQCMSFWPEGAKVGFASCLMRDRARNWWDEVTRVVGSAIVAMMKLEYFV